MKKIFGQAIQTGVVLAVSLFAYSASAHVIVTPAQTTGSSYQTFTISVPSERDAATVDVRLLVPAGLTDITPNVKPGWVITLKKADNVVTEIDWAAGRIPAGLRDQFMFSAKTPVSGTLAWKAYQTYDDGTVISWDNPPVTTPGLAVDDDAATHGPYSQTTLFGTGTGLMMDMDSGAQGSMGAMSESEHAQHIIIFIALLGLGFSIGCMYQITKIEQKLK